MFWIDAILMLVMGWLGGVISTLGWRYVLEGRAPLDPKLIPKAAAPPPLALPEILPPPEFSPYAPKRKPERKSPARDKLLGVWLQAKIERQTTWTEPKPKPPPLPRPPMPPPPQPLPAEISPDLLPSIPWGQA